MIAPERRALTIPDRDRDHGSSTSVGLRSAREAAEERLRGAAACGEAVDVVVILRGQVLPPLGNGRGRWRVRSSSGQTTFDAATVLAVTPLKRP